MRPPDYWKSSRLAMRGEGFFGGTTVAATSDGRLAPIHPRATWAGLDFGIWNFLGLWVLDFELSIPHPATPRPLAVLPHLSTFQPFNLSTFQPFNLAARLDFRLNAGGKPAPCFFSCHCPLA
jgi:hypothetical protein